MTRLEPDNCGNYVIQDSTIKNDIRDNRVKNELNRVKDELEPTTKNNLGVEDEERKLALMYLKQIKEDYIEDVGYERHPLPEYYAIETAIKSLALPSVTPQEPQDFKWCTDCREYDQEKHCCHRWSKVIRDTIEEMKQETRKGYLSIDDVMSVFDDFMCGEVDEDGTETFLEMLKDKGRK